MYRWRHAALSPHSAVIGPDTKQAPEFRIVREREREGQGGTTLTKSAGMLYWV